jgi:hypothetical protein
MVKEMPGAAAAIGLGYVKRLLQLFYRAAGAGRFAFMYSVRL